MGIPRAPQPFMAGRGNGDVWRKQYAADMAKSQREKKAAQAEAERWIAEVKARKAAR